MVYTGYTQTELDALLGILDSIPVAYEVILEDGERAQKRQRGADASVLIVAIADEALKAIPANFYAQLEPFRIYPQFIDEPEGLFEEKPQNIAPTPEAMKKSAQNMWVLRLVLVAMGAALFYSMMRSR